MKRKEHKPLTVEAEYKIMNDYDCGLARNQISRKYEISEWQLISLIKRVIEKMSMVPS